MGGMCCGNGGYVSVAEMGGKCCRNGGYVSVAEMGRMSCVVEMGGMCCRNGGVGSSCRNVGYVLWKCGVCIRCRNGRYELYKWGYVLLKWGVAEMGGMCCRNGGYVSDAETGCNRR